jgi:hypothetical protein
MVSPLAVQQDGLVSGSGPVPELRVVLVMVPPLLAGLLRQVVEARFAARRTEQGRVERSGASGSDIALSIIAEIGHPRRIAARLRRLAPHVVILGPTGQSPPWGKAALPPHTRVLTLSADLTRVDGPGPEDSALLTPDVLAGLLYQISQRI